MPRRRGSACARSCSPPLRARMAAIAAQQLREEDLVPSIQLDAEIGGRDFGVARNCDRYTSN